MRKENIGNSKRIEAGRMTGYHARTNYEGGREAYAFDGYEKNLYFTSDRTKELDNSFNRLDGKPCKGFGLEWETGWKYSNGGRDLTAKNIVANIVKHNIYPLFPAHLFKMQDDCTITGVEVISQIMTKEFIRNNYSSFKATFNDIFPQFAMTCDDGHCGMHVNISVGLFGTTEKTREIAIRKLYYIINKHYEFFATAFHRNLQNTDWCGRMNPDIAKTMDIHTMTNDHGRCFNGSHYDAGRVELRLVGGQKNFACFRNTMEVVFHIVEAVKVLSWNDCDDLTKIFEGCNSYVFDRLSSNVYRAGYITSAQLEAIRPTVKEVNYL